MKTYARTASKSLQLDEEEEKTNKNKNNVDDVTFGTGYRLFALIHVLYMPDMMYVPRDEKFVLFLFFVFVYLVGYPPLSKYLMVVVGRQFRYLYLTYFQVP